MGLNDMTKTLILCIDRDDDIGRKTKFSGPVIGVKKAVEVGNALLLADPEDTDGNSIFGAIKTQNEIKDSEVAIITGHGDVGIKSDQELTKQLKAVIKKLKPSQTVVVTDGAEDEYIIPIIQSIIPIASVKRIVVKQSENLESSYYVLKDFVNEIVKNPKLSRFFLGLPAIAFLILAVFGSTGWRLVLGAIGLYLLIKGLQFEILFNKVVNEFMNALKLGRVSFFLYVVSVIFLIIGIIHCYNKLSVFGIYDWFNSILVFINSSIIFVFISGFLFWFGKIIMLPTKEVWRFGTLLALFFSIAIVGYSATEFLLNPMIGFFNLIFSFVLGFFALLIALMVEKAHKK